MVGWSASANILLYSQFEIAVHIHFVCQRLLHHQEANSDHFLYKQRIWLIPVGDAAYSMTRMSYLRSSMILVSFVRSIVPAHSIVDHLSKLVVTKHEWVVGQFSHLSFRCTVWISWIGGTALNILRWPMHLGLLTWPRSSHQQGCSYHWQE
jgi:hypothetical protein